MNNAATSTAPLLSYLIASGAFATEIAARGAIEDAFADGHISQLELGELSRQIRARFA